MNPVEAISIYEVHADSWMRVPEQGNRPLTCDEIAPKLAGYVRQLNFTHVQLLASPDSRPGCQNGLAERLSQYDLRVLPENQERWNTAWARAMLGYLGYDPGQRKFHHAEVTRCDGEDGILPLSHDLVTRSQPSLLARMPGDEWKKFANLRLLFAGLFAWPGKKLMFMGCEFGQWNSWNPDTSLDWHLVNAENYHGKLQRFVSDLNRRYRDEPALHQLGFEWVDTSDAEASAISFLRPSQGSPETVLAVFNFTPVPRYNYRVGVPAAGFWKEILNSDALEYGGSGQGNLGGVEAAPFGWNFRTHSLTLTLPPLGAVLFRRMT